MEKRKKPRIRFKGFSDDWEQRKLGDIFEEYSEKGFSDLPALTIIQGEGTIKREDSDRSLKYDKASLLKYKRVKKGDFIVHLRSFEGGLEISKNIGVVSPAYHTFHGEGTDSTFYYWHFRSDDFIDIALKPHVYGIRDGRSINIEGMKTIKIPWTTLDEQSRIGNLIKCINRLITLHQRKLNILKSVPKFLLGIVWEQRKLGACFEERCENMPDGELISVTISDGIKKFSELGRHDNSNQDKSKYKKVCIGDIAYNSMRMWQGASGYSPFEGIVSPAYTVLKPNVNINSKCVSYLFKRQDMIHVFQLNSQGITSDNWNLKFPALSQIAVSLPGDIKEQSRIATYFSNIDTLITLHQRQQNLWKFVRKGVKLWIILTKNQILKRP